MVVDDVEVGNGFRLGGSDELGVEFGFARSLCVHSEVGGLVQLHTWGAGSEGGPMINKAIALVLLFF